MAMCYLAIFYNAPVNIRYHSIIALGVSLAAAVFKATTIGLCSPHAKLD